VTTTPLGIPKYAQTDNADIASKLNAIADATNGLFTERTTPIAAKRVLRSDGNKFTVNPSTDKLVTSFNTVPLSAGLLTYSGGTVTVGTGGAGLFLLSLNTGWPGSTGAGPYSRLVGYYLNGSRISGLTGCDQRTVSGGEGSRQFNVTSTIPLSDGDQIQPFLWQSGPVAEDVYVRDWALVRVF
jgi:hypothetical protein